MASTKYLAKGNIGETRFVLAQFERTAHHEGKAEQQGPEAAAHIATAVRKQQGMNPEAQVACSFLFSAGLQPKGGATNILVGSPLLSQCFWKHSRGHVKRCVSSEN